MTLSREPAECWPVGSYVDDEMQERHWSRAKLAERMGVEESVVDSILDGTLPLSAVLACKLEEALGVSAALWVNLDMAYRRWARRKGVTR